MICPMSFPRKRESIPSLRSRPRSSSGGRSNLKIGTVPQGVISLRSGLSLFLIFAFLSKISLALESSPSLQIATKLRDPEFRAEAKAKLTDVYAQRHPTEQAQLLVAKSKQEIEMIERVGVAIRSMRHNGSLDAGAGIISACSGINIIGRSLGTSTQRLKPLLERIIYDFVKDVRQDFRDSIYGMIGSIGEQSKEGNLTIDIAKGVISRLQTILENVRSSRGKIEEIQSEFNSTYVGGASEKEEALKLFGKILIKLDRSVAILQSRVEMVTAVANLHSPQPIVEIINDACRSKSQSVTAVNNLPTSVRINSNPVTITSAIFNIVNNATYFADRRQDGNGSVRVVSTVENGFVKVDITDNGEGIPKELLEIDPMTGRPRLFRLNISQRKGGIGLGTTEAWYAIQDMGGTIDVNSLTQEEYERLGLSVILDIDYLRKLIDGVRSNSVNRELAQEIHMEIRLLFDKYITPLDRMIKEGNITEDNLDYQKIYSSHIVKFNDDLEVYHERIIAEGMKDSKAAQTAAPFIFNEIRNRFAALGTHKVRFDMGDKITRRETMDLIKSRIFLVNAALECHRRAAFGLRTDVGTTFTLRLPIADAVGHTSLNDKFVEGSIYDPQFIQREQERSSRRKTLAFDLEETLVLKEHNKYRLVHDTETELEQLKRSGLRLVIWTHAPRQRAEEVLRAVPGLSEYFDLIITNENYVVSSEGDKILWLQHYTGFIDENEWQNLVRMIDRRKADPNDRRLKAMNRATEYFLKGSWPKDVSLLGYSALIDNAEHCREWGLNSPSGQFIGYRLVAMKMMHGLAQAVLQLLGMAGGEQAPLPATGAANLPEMERAIPERLKAAHDVERRA